MTSATKNRRQKQTERTLNVPFGHSLSVFPSYVHWRFWNRKRGADAAGETRLSINCMIGGSIRGNTCLFIYFLNVPYSIRLFLRECVFIVERTLWGGLFNSATNYNAPSGGCSRVRAYQRRITHKATSTKIKLLHSHQMSTSTRFKPAANSTVSRWINIVIVNKLHRLQAWYVIRTSTWRSFYDSENQMRKIRGTYMRQDSHVCGAILVRSWCNHRSNRTRVIGGR